ncbi:TraR/DksA C4-type zinc finger protein [Candidatus Nomurabacteria bacterium]|nr:TraR/DksA C4-type zinc finger protein [Candidatus Nomurabacteria bacterium]
MLDKKQIKEELEKERDLLVEELKSMGKLNPQTGEWEAIPDSSEQESDPNSAADRFEDYEERSSMTRDLGARLSSILNSLKNINKGSFAKCEVCGKEIEIDRMKANPAAKTCKKHLNN